MSPFNENLRKTCGYCGEQGTNFFLLTVVSNCDQVPSLRNLLFAFQGHNRRTCTKYPRETKKKKTKRKTKRWTVAQSEMLRGGPSRFVGVSWNEGEGAWIASVTHGESPTRYLGSFRTEEEAARCFAQYVSAFGFR